MKQRKRNAKAVWIACGMVFVCVIAAFVAYFLGLGEERKYPLKYQQPLCQFALQYQLDPNLVAALIYAESGFRDDAKSKKGARGLMQIMPQTGLWIAQKIGYEEQYDESWLDVPERNIELGCWFLRYLLDKFDEPAVALAAYNAGEGNVRRWLQDEQYSQDGKTLLKMEYQETEKYVQKVLQAQKKYEAIYCLGS